MISNHYISRKNNRLALGLGAAAIGLMVSPASANALDDPSPPPLLNGMPVEPGATRPPKENMPTIECAAPCGLFFTAYRMKNATARGTDAEPEFLSAGTLGTFFGDKQRFHDHRIQWDFGDQNSAFTATKVYPVTEEGAGHNPPNLIQEFALPTNPLPENVDGTTDANTAIGAFAGHVFAIPGMYTVNGTPIRNGRAGGRIEEPVTVVDPSSVWDKARTVCIGPNASSYSTSLCGQTAASWGEVVGVGNNLKNYGSDRRVLFQAGETHEFGAMLQFRGEGQRFYLGSFGSGAAPVLKVKPGVTAIRLRGVEEAIITGIKFDGCYNAASGRYDGGEDKNATPDGFCDIVLPASEAGDLVGPNAENIDIGAAVQIIAESQSNPSRQIPSRNITIYKNSFSGFRTAIEISGNFGSGGSPLGAVNTVIADNTITNWYEFGIKGPGKNLAIIGNRITQNRDAKQDFGKTETEKTCSDEDNQGNCLDTSGRHVNSTDQEFVVANHGPVRIDQADGVVIANNYMFSNTGWSGRQNQSGPDKLFLQPTIRYGTSVFGNHSGVISRNVLEGGAHVIETVVGAEASGLSTSSDFGSILIEENVLISSENTRRSYYTNLAGVTFRKNVLFTPFADIAVDDNLIEQPYVSGIVAYGEPTVVSMADSDGPMNFVDNIMIVQRCETLELLDFFHNSVSGENPNDPNNVNGTPTFVNASISETGNVVWTQIDDSVDC